jgi:hypothetical protein
LDEIFGSTLFSGSTFLEEKTPYNNYPVDNRKYNRRPGHVHMPGELYAEFSFQDKHSERSSGDQHNERDDSQVKVKGKTVDDDMARWSSHEIID